MSIGMIVDTVGGRMPKCCDGCDLEEWNHNAMEYTCVLNEYDLRTPEERSKSIGDWCPLQEVEPVRHGHWIKGYDYGATHPPIPIMICSVCGWKWYNQQIGSRYCPGCGAKLDGGAE